MKVLLKFFNNDHKSEIITPFLNMQDCIVTDKQLVVPKMVKIVFDESISCYCLSLSIAELILSSICMITTDTDNNIGEITFPRELTDIILEVKTKSFPKVMELASTGKIKYINSKIEEVKMLVPLSQWLSADVNVSEANAYINFKLNDYSINVSDQSATRFCTRVKQHPLIAASMLTEYFDFGDEIQLKPVIEYLCFWKLLKAENGYKKYANCMNECKSIMNITYDDGKKYRCDFDGGKLEFQLTAIGDKYPNKVILQFDKINLEVLESLKKNLSLKTIELVCKITSLQLSTNTLLRKLRFFKADNFFMFENVYDNLKAEYDISTNVMLIKREIKLDNITDNDIFIKTMDDTKAWMNNLIKEGK